ncbi:MAG: hypothetical protein H6730_06390 [Deltaproteobacteria bacterium]|nr:hypothetical protein [Deltaproteobacteria bacterium]
MLAASAALSLTGCPAEQPQAPDAGAPVAPAAPDAGPIEVVRVDPVEPVPDPGCSQGPGWLRLTPCRRGPHVYAVGSAPVDLNASLGRTRATEQARFALAEALDQVDKEGQVTVRRSEVPQVHRCEDVLYALARIEYPAPNLPACPDAVDDPATTPAGCPEWTRGVAWLEDGAWVGVAQVDGIKNPVLARNAAVNRARHAVAAALEIDLAKRERGLGAVVHPRPLAERGSEVAECAGSVWGKVVTEGR